MMSISLMILKNFLKNFLEKYLKEVIKKMSNEYIIDSIASAKNSLDSLDQMGEIAFDMCDGSLMNIKAFIHDEAIKQKIIEKEKSVNQEFQKRMNKANQDLNTKGPLYAWRDGMKKYYKLRHWQSLEMLNFYDKLCREHDL